MTLEQRAREWLRRRQTGDVDVSQLVRPVPMIVESLSAKVPELASLGDPATFAFVRSDTNPLGFTNHTFHVGFSNGTSVQYIFGLSPDGMVNKLGFSNIEGEPSPFDMRPRL